MGHRQLISVAIGIGAWLIAAALNILQGPQWLGWIFFALGCGFFISAGLWLIHGSFQPGTQQLPEPSRDAATTPAPVPQPTSEPRESESQERTFIDVTPAYLVSLFEDHTSIQAQKLTEAYVGKWMRVSGRLGDVMTRERLPTVQVTFERRSLMDAARVYYALFMYFDKAKWLERLAVLRHGDVITVLGRLREANGVEVHLEDCELVD